MQSNHQTMGDSFVIRPDSLCVVSAVEMPCYVGSIETAISMLGGKNGSLQTAHNVGSLQFSLKNEAEVLTGDNIAMKQPLRSHAEPAQGFLLKMTRRKKFDSAGSLLVSSTSTEVVGKILRRHEFSDPCDFQVKNSFYSFNFMIYAK